MGEGGKGSTAFSSFDKLRTSGNSHHGLRTSGDPTREVAGTLIWRSA